MNNTSPFTYIVEKLNFSKVKELIEEREIDINSDDNKLALIELSKNNNNYYLPLRIQMAKYLIEKGIDIYATNNLGRTALFYSNIEISELLINKCPLEKRKEFINHQDNDGITALMKVAYDYDINKVSFLLEHKADIHIKNNCGETVINQRYKNIYNTDYIYDIEYEIEMNENIEEDKRHLVQLFFDAGADIDDFKNEIEYKRIIYEDYYYDYVLNPILKSFNDEEQQKMNKIIKLNDMKKFILPNIPFKDDLLQIIIMDEIMFSFVNKLLNQ